MKTSQNKDKIMFVLVLLVLALITFSCKKKDKYSGCCTYTVKYTNHTSPNVTTDFCKSNISEDEKDGYIKTYNDQVNNAGLSTGTLNETKVVGTGCSFNKE